MSLTIRSIVLVLTASLLLGSAPISAQEPQAEGDPGAESETQDADGQQDAGDHEVDYLGTEGRLTDWTLGVNWYWTRYTRWSINYINAWLHDAGHVPIVQARFQIFI